MAQYFNYPSYTGSNWSALPKRSPMTPDSNLYFSTNLCIVNHDKWIADPGSHSTGSNHHHPMVDRLDLQHWPGCGWRGPQKTNGTPTATWVIKPQIYSLPMQDQNRRNTTCGDSGGASNNTRSSGNNNYMSYNYYSVLINWSRVKSDHLENVEQAPRASLRQIIQKLLDV